MQLKPREPERPPSGLQRQRAALETAAATSPSGAADDIDYEAVQELARQLMVEGDETQMVLLEELMQDAYALDDNVDPATNCVISKSLKREHGARSSGYGERGGAWQRKADSGKWCKKTRGGTIYTLQKVAGFVSKGLGFHWAKIKSNNNIYVNIFPLALTTDP